MKLCFSFLNNFDVYFKTFIYFYFASLRLNKRFVDQEIHIISLFQRGKVEAKFYSVLFITQWIFNKLRIRSPMAYQIYYLQFLSYHC